MLTLSTILAFPIWRFLIEFWTGTVNLTRQLIIRESLAYDLPHGNIEPLRIVEAPAVVVPKALLIEIPEQMERLDTHIDPVDPALQKAPEILKTVRVSADLLWSTISALMAPFFRRSSLKPSCSLSACISVGPLGLGGATP